MTVDWDVAPCSLVDTADVSEELTTSITSKILWNFGQYLPVRRNIPEDSWWR
jgi:hypothetical protein